MPYAALRVLLQNWANGGTSDADLISRLNETYHVEDTVYAYQKIANTIDPADEANVDISTKRNELQDTIKILLIDESRRITDENNRNDKLEWERKNNETFAICNVTANTTLFNAYNARLSEERRAEFEVELAYNLTEGYGNTTAVANRTSLAIDLLSASDQFARGNLSQQICITSNEADWNREVSAVW